MATLLNEYLNNEITLIDLMVDLLEYFDNDIHSVIEYLENVSEIDMSADELLEYYDNN